MRTHLKRVIEVVIKQWFLCGLLLAIVTALNWPAIGSTGFIASAAYGKIAVAIIFFFQGLQIALPQMRESLGNWRAHVLMQVMIFAVLPLLMYGFVSTLRPVIGDALATGFLLLGVLPTTLSTCVVFTSLAGGNAALAALNSTLSNLAGVIVVPVFCHHFFQSDHATKSLTEDVLGLAAISAIPLVIGLLLRALLQLKWPKSLLQNLSSALVLSLVFTSFCKAAKTEAFSQVSLGNFAVVAAGTIVVFCVATGLALLGSRLLKFTQADEVAVIFCAPQKTLAAGVPMAHALFTGHPMLAVVLLPLLVYHPLQLLFGAWIISYIKRQTSVI